MYDIIGDIHGHATELVELLSKLGYVKRGDCFRHKSRKVVFCGDFIDRGPHIPEAVNIAKDMVENHAAMAVMGNHEFNALAYHTENPTQPGHYLRPHNSRNNRQHAETARQFASANLADALNWFRSLPVSLDLGNVRIVHACWHPVQIRVIEDAIRELGCFTPAFLKQAMSKRNRLFDAIECVLKGPELQLPDGVTVRDKEGNIRKKIRIRWYDSPKNQTWATYAFPVKPELPDYPVPATSPAVPYPENAPPVFVGHYWIPDNTPTALKPNFACLDYSVAKEGLLCAYRFDGETALNDNKFVWVKTHNHEASQ